MPAHFQRAAGAEAHNERTVGLILECLRWMKQELPCVGRGFRGEAPHHTEGLFLKNTERALGKFLQGKAFAAGAGTPQ